MLWNKLERHKLKLKHKLQNRDIDIEEDKRIPAFKESHSTIDNENKDSTNFENNNDQDDVITFGDELDVPAFIRNRKAR